MVTWSTLQNAGACSTPPPLLHRRPCLFKISLNLLEQKNAIYDDFLEETIESVDILPTSNSNSDTTPFFTHTHNFYLYFLTQESETLDTLSRILVVMPSPMKCNIVATLPTSAFYFAIIHFDSWVQNKMASRRKGLTS